MPLWIVFVKLPTSKKEIVSMFQSITHIPYKWSQHQVQTKLNNNWCLIIYWGVGVIKHFAGYGAKEFKDGSFESSLFGTPCGVTIDELTGDVFVADHGNHIIRRISQQGISFCHNYNTYIFFNIKIFLPLIYLLVTTQIGVASTLAGTPGKKGLVDGTKEVALFQGPWGIHFSQIHRFLVVCDFLNNRVRNVTLSGISFFFCCSFF